MMIPIADFEMNISKQAVGKILQAAATSLRERLAALGYHGIDTVGFLKSPDGSASQTQSNIESKI